LISSARSVEGSCLASAPFWGAEELAGFGGSTGILDPKKLPRYIPDPLFEDGLNLTLYHATCPNNDHGHRWRYQVQFGFEPEVNRRSTEKSPTVGVREVIGGNESLFGPQFADDIQRHALFMLIQPTRHFSPSPGVQGHPHPM
jgi:hypothetical protein